MAKKNPTLKFDKSKSTSKNHEEFEKYVLQLDRDLGKILLSHLNSSDNLREDIKDEVMKYINQNTSDE